VFVDVTPIQRTARPNHFLRDLNVTGEQVRRPAISGDYWKHVTAKLEESSENGSNRKRSRRLREWKRINV
jgi:hypothetical protein